MTCAETEFYTKEVCAILEQRLIDSIEFCKWRYGWTVTIKDFYNLMLKTNGTSELMRWFINHENEYCQLIKSNHVAFSHCVDIGNRGLCAKLKAMPQASDGFVGTCYGGVREFVMPVYYENTVLGAVIVGSCKCGQARRQTTFDRLSEEFGFDRQELEQCYDAHLREELEDLPLIRHEATLWAACIQALCERHLEKRLFEEAVRSAEGGHDPRGDKLNQAILYIKANLASRLTVEQVARNCYCSESTIAHLFKEELNVGVNAFIIGERIALAQRMLRHSDATVAEIAVRCGFGSNKYMTGMFKKRTGMTPAEYRIRHRS